MSFDSGSVSMRVFKVVLGGKPLLSVGEYVEKLAKKAIVPVESIPDGGISGWATSRHLLDRNITLETAVIAGKLAVTLVRAEKKIPSALFKTECKQEELARMAATGAAFLKKAERAEIAKSVRERLQPTMPPTLSGIDLVGSDGTYYATAMSESNMDHLVASWNEATGHGIIPYVPEVASQMLLGKDVRGLDPTTFSPEGMDPADQGVGSEFLTWLWYFAESSGGMLDVEGRKYGFMVEGPLTFIHEGAGSHETILRKGNPSIAREAKSALVAGKKLSKARLTVVCDDETWSCNFDGQTWGFASLKLPKGEPTDPVGRFDDRMRLIGRMVQAVEAAYVRFLNVRTDEQKWKSEVESIRRWVSDRQERA